MRTLARLQDVERQLCTTATAVQLHLRGLEGEREREHIAWAQIAALALVCGRIEQVQSELSQSTVEILALARKNLAGGGSADKGEETETEGEDEDVELEDGQRLKGEPRRQAEEVEAQVEHCGEQDGASNEEDKQDEVILKVERGAMAENAAWVGVVEEETKESDDRSLTHVGTAGDEMESSEAKRICESDGEVKREMIAGNELVGAREQSSLNEEGQLCDAAAETEKAELIVEEIRRRNENEMQKVGVEITETGCTLDGLENVEESKQSETTEVNHELTTETEGGAVEVASDSRMAPNEAKCEEEQVEIEVRTADAKDSELPAAAEPKTTTEPESVKEIPVELLENMIFMVENTKTIGTRTIANETNTSSVEADDHGNPVNGFFEIEKKRTSVAVIRGECEETQQALVTIVKQVQGKELITQKTEFRNGETSESPEANVREKELEQNVKAARQRAADAINNFRRSLKSGNCTVDAAVNFTGIVRDTASIVTSHDSKYSRRIWIEQVVFICKSILQDAHETELAQVLSPLTESCSHLQRYISSHFPDYLQDILNDIDTLQNSRGLNSSQLAFWLPRLLKQLRKDCGVYYKKIKGNSGELRSDEKWDQLTLICERLTKWIKQLSPGDTNKFGNDQHQTMETLTAFNEYFPNRIPTELLEAMCCAAGPFGVWINVNDSTSKKRLRDDSECAGPELKRTAHQSSNDKVNPIARRYLQIATDAKSGGLCITESISDLKTIATMAITELSKIFKDDDIPSVKTTECFRLATQLMTHTISVLPGNFVEYGWLRKTIFALRQLFHLGASTILRNERDSLSESISVLEMYLGGTYLVEGDFVPTLDEIEERVCRFQTLKWNCKTVMSPIQSISSGLLTDLRKNNTTCLVRSEQNWLRFTAVVNALLDWITRALKLAVPRSGLLHKLLGELQEFDVKCPGRLPPSLISKCEALARFDSKISRIKINAGSSHPAQRRKPKKQPKPPKGIRIYQNNGQVVILPAGEEP